MQAEPQTPHGIQRGPTTLRRVPTVPTGSSHGRSSRRQRSASSPDINSCRRGEHGPGVPRVTGGSEGGWGDPMGKGRGARGWGGHGGAVGGRGARGGRTLRA